jgi:hypothetical protein
MRHPSIAASASSNTEGPSDLSTRHKEALLTFLGIPTELPSQDPTLRAAYAKYKVLVSSAKKMSNLRSNQEWTEHLEEFGIEHWIPVFADLANIFIAKSQFYVSWKPSFKKAQGYPKMIAWLDDASDCDSDSELWGETKDTDDYSLGDLKDWLGKKDVVKGKKPAATGSSAGKKEKRKKDKRAPSESSSSSESSEEKNVKAKAKGKKGKKKASE